MPKPRTKEEIRCRYFRWLLGQRNGVYFADGRSNHPSLGRHSLGTKCKEEAENLIHDLDLKMAVKYGLADRSMIHTEPSQLLEFQAGRELYEKYVNRPAVAGGPRKTTTKRYRAVLDKFQSFIQNSGLRYWNEVDRSILDSYAGWLDGESYAYATEYLELNTIKQILNFLYKTIISLPRFCSSTRSGNLREQTRIAGNLRKFKRCLIIARPRNSAGCGIFSSH